MLNSSGKHWHVVPGAGLIPPIRAAESRCPDAERRKIPAAHCPDDERRKDSSELFLQDGPGTRIWALSALSTVLSSFSMC